MSRIANLTYMEYHSKISIVVKTNLNTSVRQFIAEDKRQVIQELKIIGPYRSKYDDSTIRSMCNTIGKNGQRTGGRLEILDLSDAFLMRNFYADNFLDFGFVGSMAFSNCITLREIKFGKSLVKVDGKDFSGCLSLERILVSDDNVSYKSIDGILYQTSYSANWSTSTRNDYPEGHWRLVKVPSNMQDASAIRFDLIDSIDNYAFEDTRLTELWMPAIPPACASSAFYNVDVSKITLHVPSESFDSY